MTKSFEEPRMLPNDTVVEKLMHAIAKAEGFYDPSSRPARNHNPGDFERDITGTAVGHDGPYMVYPDDKTGWDVLRVQVRLMFNGSHIYNPKMTIAQVASHYVEDAPGQANWARIVADDLGVSTLTRLEELLNGSQEKTS